MKKIILGLALLSVSVFVGKALADEVSTKVADAVVGTEDKAYRVKGVVFTCDANGDLITTDARICYGVLRSGDSTSDPVLLHFTVSATNPTLQVDYTWVNKTSASNLKTGVLFNSGIYYDEVTGGTAITVVYEPK